MKKVTLKMVEMLVIMGMANMVDMVDMVMKVRYDRLQYGVVGSNR